MTATEESRKQASIVAKAANEKLGKDIAVIDVSDVMAISDIFVVITGDNERQVRAITDEVDEKMSEAGFEPKRREGNREFRWVLLDYGQVVVHIQRTTEREFYGLDGLYADCPRIAVDGVETAQTPGKWADEVNVREIDDIEDLPLAGAEPEDEDEGYY
ncbi:ribosome silencing factor [Corynebacterium cystitidis]|uniref:ribosome silencing factor n=1 Tax=Corynebacterium cystitidis TaxID=35757 RepID=UPI00211E949A|nr:ribosome silencing factor [Corynebacterium cystitidis]